MQPSSFVFEKKSHHEQNIPTFTCVPKPVFDEILEALRPRFTQYKNSVSLKNSKFFSGLKNAPEWHPFLLLLLDLFQN